MTSESAPTVLNAARTSLGIARSLGREDFLQAQGTDAELSRIWLLDRCEKVVRYPGNAAQEEDDWADSSATLIRLVVSYGLPRDLVQQLLLSLVSHRLVYQVAARDNASGHDDSFALSQTRWVSDWLTNLAFTGVGFYAQKRSELDSHIYLVSSAVRGSFPATSSPTSPSDGEAIDRLLSGDDDGPDEVDCDDCARHLESIVENGPPRLVLLWFCMTVVSGYRDRLPADKHRANIPGEVEDFWDACVSRLRRYSDGLALETIAEAGGYDPKGLHPATMLGGSKRAWPEYDPDQDRPIEESLLSAFNETLFKAFRRAPEGSLTALDGLRARVSDVIPHVATALLEPLIVDYKDIQLQIVTELLCHIKSREQFPRGE